MKSKNQVSLIFILYHAKNYFVSESLKGSKSANAAVTSNFDTATSPNMKL